MEVNWRYSRDVVRIPLVAILGFAAWGQADAQAVRVRVVEDAGARAVGGALVALISPGGAVRVEAVTGESGWRMLVAPEPGTYRVRVRRIGYAPMLSAAVTLARSDTTTLELRVAELKIALPTVSVRESKQCAGQPGETARVAVVWEEVRKALQVSELTRAGSLLTLAARNHRQWLSRRGQVEYADTTAVRFVVGSAFEARSAADLSRYGYIVGTEGAGRSYYAPDAASLLSDDFVRDHCFQLVAGSGDTEGLIGLQFEPVPGRWLPDIEGELWLDERTAELRHLEFRYVNAAVPSGLTHTLGGRIDFERLESGLWIVRDWVVRMPRLARAKGQPPGVSSPGYLEAGGFAAPAADSIAVASAVADTGARPAQPQLVGAARGAITGTVFDSLLQAPLAGARVWLPMAGRRTVTDSLGRFEVDTIFTGDHRVEFWHAGLDSVGLSSLGTNVVVEADETTPVELAAPSLARYQLLACGDTLSPRDSTGIVYGTIREAETDEAIAGAQVRLSWLARTDTAGRFGAELRTLSGVADETGLFYACGVPTNAAVTVLATAGPFEGGDIDVALGARRIARVDLAVSRDSAASVGAADPVSPGRGAAGARARPAAAPRGRAVLLGIVRDRTGAAKEDAQVVLPDAMAEARTSATGAFVLADLPAGTRMVDVRLIGFAPVRMPVTLRNDDTTRVDVTLVPATMLATVNVAASRLTRVLSEVEERRRLGGGYFLAADEIARRNTTRSLFLDMPSVQVSGYASPLGVRRGERGLAIMMRSRNAYEALCSPDFYIDDRPAVSEELDTYRLSDLVAIEVYTNEANAPAKYRRSRGNCGIVLVWTRFMD
ncbi:MAG: carboxypeptidase regulatory-like domain-containing protein [Gemmatimonadota bacterium]|nr:carboxypeptidase regulatory-like domain-containing protein [Gemmatimonadota bacterium]